MKKITKPLKSKEYQDIIDELVQMCRNGQGQIGARRVREGVWNQNANADFLPDQHAINLFLARLTDSDRAILASMLTRAVELGVFETLKTLEQFEVEPFTEGYEGSPFHDFVGRIY